MSYLVRFTDPEGTKFFAVNPHVHHALYGAREHATEFETAQKGIQFMQWNVHCVHAFWESEREHARRVRQSLRGWDVSVVPARTEPLK